MSEPTEQQVALQKLDRICDEIFERWDKDRRSGKLLTALAGRVPGYRADVDEVRAALSAAAPRQAEVASRQWQIATDIATRMVAGEPYTDNDVHQLAEADMVPDAIKGVLTEKEEWRQKYGTSAAEIERLRQALETAPRPSSEKAWLIPYIDWFFKTRIAALRGDEQTPGQTK